MRQTVHSLADALPVPASPARAERPVPEPVEPAVPALLAEIAAPSGVADPYPIYDRLRALGDAVPGPDDSVVVTGYRLCSALLREPRLRKHPGRLLVGAGFPDWETRPALNLMFKSMLMLNPPEHTRIRSLVSRVFTARRVAAMRPAVEAIADGLLAELHGTVDFVDAVAFPFPVAVIGELIGVPAPERAMFRGLVDEWTSVLEILSPPAVDRADRAAQAIVDYFTDLVAQRRREPQDDLVSALVTAGDPGLGTDHPALATAGDAALATAGDAALATADHPGARLSDEDLVRTVALIFAAGFETTTGLLSNGLVALLNHPDQAARLAAEPTLAKPAVEELLRYDTPVQIVYGRTAVDDVRVDDLHLHAGQRVINILGAANRDPSVFTAPERLSLDRAEGMPLSFGAGIHHCLGAALARLEGQIMFPRLLRRFPRLRLAGEPERRVSTTLRGYRSLPVTVD